MANICKKWVIFDVSPTFNFAFLIIVYKSYIVNIRIYAYADLTTVYLSFSCVVIEVTLNKYDGSTLVT